MDRSSLVAKGFAVLGYRGIVGGERDFRVSGGEISCIEACAEGILYFTFLSIITQKVV